MTIIAEIGTSHGGSLEKAMALIDAAKEAGADCVKFQWVYADEILHPETGLVDLPGGKTRLYDVFKDLECGLDFFSQCIEYTHKKNLLFACSPFGKRSLSELVSLTPDAIKIASPEVNHILLLKECSRFYGKIPLILSGGVSKLGDLEKAVEILTSCSTPSKSENLFLPPLTLLHCVTSYPAPEKECNVKCVETLSSVFGIPTGISDHSLDPVLVPVLSVAEGGKIIEKHITLSKKDSGLDDPVALEKEAFSAMVHSVRQAEAILERYKKEEKATGYNLKEKAKDEIIRQLAFEYPLEKIKATLGTGIKVLAPSEKENYGRTNRSLHYMKNLKKGEKVSRNTIAILRTEKELSPGILPDFLDTLIGAELFRDVKSGDGVQWDDFLHR